MQLKAKHPKKATPKRPKVLIYGPAGVGKTWCAMDFPSAYLVDCEGGATRDEYTDKLEAAGGVYLGQEDGANDMNVVVGQVMALAMTDHEHKTLVIDSFSKLFNTAIQVEYDRLDSMKRDMNKTFGAEKKPAIAKTRQMIRWFEKLDMNVLLICHEKALWKDGDQIGVTFDGWDKLEYELDLSMQILKMGPDRKAKVCKSRIKQFRDGELIEWSYASFAKRYGIEVVESEATHVDPAESEQIRVVEELANVVKLEDGMRLKWFEKAGVNSWAEMDAQTIQACIDHLKKQLPQSAA